jgi:hypothetical protein
MRCGALGAFQGWLAAIVKIQADARSRVLVFPESDKEAWDEEMRRINSSLAWSDIDPVTYHQRKVRLMRVWMVTGGVVGMIIGVLIKLLLNN